MPWTDLKAMELSRWGDISDAALDKFIEGYLRRRGRGHGAAALGRRPLDGRLSPRACMCSDGAWRDRSRASGEFAHRRTARVQRRWYEG